MSIYSEIKKNTIDWETVEKEIIDLGDSINDRDEDETKLSELILGFVGSGDIIRRVTELFLKHGYDVKGNDGFNGAQCLHQLIWSTYDQYILETAEVLLNAGANTKVPYDEDDESDYGVLNSIEWGLGHWMEGEYDSANIFEAYYEMVNAYENGKPYKGIRAFRECVGKKVTKVEKVSYSKDKIAYDVANSGAFSDALIIWAEGIPLVASVYVDFIVNPYALSNTVNRLDISDEVKDIIGATITGLRFTTSQNASLNFDNGYSIKFSGAVAWGYEGFNKAHYFIGKQQNHCPLLSGMWVDAIILKSGRNWSDNIYKYHEDTVVLLIGDKMYQVYSKGKRGGAHHLEFEQIPVDCIGPTHRRIVAGKMFVGAVMRNNNNQAVYLHLIDGNENIIITVDEHYDEVIYARTGINETGEEVFIHMKFEDKSEWAKQEFPKQR